MAEKDITDERFVFRLLTCVQEQQQTEEELRSRYVRMYPPSFLTRSIIGYISQEKISHALQILYSEGLVRRQLTRYTDRVLKKDTFVYCLSDKGRTSLLAKKKKK